MIPFQKSMGMDLGQFRKGLFQKVRRRNIIIFTAAKVVRVTINKCASPGFSIKNAIYLLRRETNK
jgi:hypothetical protein